MRSLTRDLTRSVFYWKKKKNSSSPRCHMGSQSLELELLCAVSRAAKMPKVRGLHANNTAHVSNEITGSSV